MLKRGDFPTRWEGVAQRVGHSSFQGVVYRLLSPRELKKKVCDHPHLTFSEAKTCASQAAFQFNRSTP